MMVDTIAFSEIHHKFEEHHAFISGALKKASEIAFEISIMEERRQFNYFEFMHKFFCEYLAQQDLTCYELQRIIEIVNEYINKAITIPMKNKRWH